MKKKKVFLFFTLLFLAIVLIIILWQQKTAKDEREYRARELSKCISVAEKNIKTDDREYGITRCHLLWGKPINLVPYSK